MTANSFVVAFHATDVRQGAQQWGFTSPSMLHSQLMFVRYVMTYLTKHVHVQVLADWTV